MSAGNMLAPTQPEPPSVSVQVFSQQEWAQLIEWHGKLSVLHTLQGSPVGRDEDGQKAYLTLLASWILYEGPLPPPIASPERKKRREKQQAKKQSGGGAVECGEGSGTADKFRRVGELEYRAQALVREHGWDAMVHSDEYQRCQEEKFALMRELNLDL